jgi:hypothetical protein
LEGGKVWENSPSTPLTSLSLRNDGWAIAPTLQILRLDSCWQTILAPQLCCFQDVASAIFSLRATAKEKDRRYQNEKESNTHQYPTQANFVFGSLYPCTTALTHFSAISAEESKCFCVQARKSKVGSSRGDVEYSPIESCVFHHLSFPSSLFYQIPPFRIKTP